MDVPGNVLYIKRLHKEVYLAAHLPVVEYDEKNADNVNGPVLTTIASKVLNSYEELLVETSSQPQEMASFNNADTWHINQTTGLLNVDTQTITNIDYNLKKASDQASLRSISQVPLLIQSPNNSIQNCQNGRTGFLSTMGSNTPQCCSISTTTQHPR